MNINSLKFTGLLGLVALLAIGCASVNYVGKSFEPTTNVDLYFSKEDIEKEYTVMGHAIGSGTSDSDDIQQALIDKAKEKGWAFNPTFSHVHPACSINAGRE